MSKLILEFERNGKTQEPESKFCYVVKNLILFEYNCDSTPYLKFYVTEKNELMIMRNIHSGTTHVNYKKLWSMFFGKYSDYDQVQLVTTKLLKHHFKEHVLSTTPRDF